VIEFEYEEYLVHPNKSKGLTDEFKILLTVFDGSSTGVGRPDDGVTITGISCSS